MDEKILLEKTISIVKDVLQNKNLTLNASSSSKDVEGWDSLRHVMIISEVEKEFAISIDFMEVLEIKTIGDICTSVSKQLKND
ncbi:MAG: acyl carrier protein [Bacteroidales bacterium]|nr:acyl carrier protein [Bacteroidales bacterium]